MIGYAASGTAKPFRLPDWIPTEANRSYWRAHDTVHAYINTMLDARLALDESQYPNDLLSKLITAEDAETGERMSRDLLRDEALTSFFAGYETSARSMSHAWYALAQNQARRCCYSHISPIAIWISGMIRCVLNLSGTRLTPKRLVIRRRTTRLPLDSGFAWGTISRYWKPTSC